MIIVNVCFKVGTVLFEQDQKVRVVAYQIFRYPRIRLTEIEAVGLLRRQTPDRQCSSRIDFDMSTQRLQLLGGKSCDRG